MKHKTLTVVVFVTFVISCGTVRPITGEQSECRLPATTMALTPRHFELTALEFHKFKLGGITVDNKAEVWTVATESQNNLLLVDYLTCRAQQRGDIEKGNLQQIDYLRRWLSLMTVKPTPEQLDAWQKTNPFPRSR